MHLDPEILRIFLDEADSYLQRIKDRASSREQRLRAALGLRGTAAQLGLDQLNEATRRIERSLSDDDDADLTHGLRQAWELLDSMVLARAPVDAAAAGASASGRPGVAPAAADQGIQLDEEWDPQTAQMIRQLFAEEAQDHLEAIISGLMGLEGGDPGNPRALLEEMLRKAHTLKGSAATVGLHRISRAAHLLEECLVAIKERHVAPDGAVVDQMIQAADTIRDMVSATPEQAQTLLLELQQELQAGGAVAGTRRPTQSKPPTDRRQDERRGSPDRRHEEATVRVDVGRLDQLMNTTGELVIDRTRIERRVEELRDLARDVSTVRRELHRVLAGLGSLAAAEQEQVSGLEGALADAASNLDRSTSSLNEDSEALRRTTGSLQEHLTQIRMIPIRWLHARLLRPLREMARSQGKQAELIIRDEATEVDRSLVAQITDPLIHLVRNAVAHGIETPDQRQQQGKPPVGHIEITARHHGDVVFLEVQDDGAGIDPALLRQTIRQRGEMDQRVLDALGDDEVLDIIFTSGFTTRAAADQLSGRGLGLDVVRQNIGQLGGDIRVRSRPGQGTRFTIQMPMTTAIAQALLFKAGDQVYAIPVAHVAETQMAEPGEMEEQQDQCRLRTRHGWIPLLHLHRVLGLSAPVPLQPRAATAGARAALPVIIIRLGEMRFGITCSRVVGPREIVLKGLGSLLAPHPMLAAATISGSNKVQFVLDVAFLAQAALAGVGAGPTRRPPTGPQPPAAGAIILLVDDSRTVREAVAHMLRRAGLRVELAADGRQAWDKLQIRAYDLLLTDLEMPRLHGLELISRCRQSPLLAHLPIVVLSSRSTTESRGQALRKGADAFLAKPVNRRMLLRELRRYLTVS